MRPLPVMICLWLLATGLFAQTSAQENIFFDHNEASLSTASIEKMEALANQLNGVFDYTVHINAYTDNTGSSTYNQQLARERANAVMQFLQNQGIATDKLSVNSWGESKQLYPNDTEEGRQLNRRVDIDVKTWSMEDPNHLFDCLTKEDNQSYLIDQHNGYTLKTPNGTTIVVPANSLVFEDGTIPAGQITLTLREAYNAGSWMANGLSTLSDGALLQSGGMLYIGAEADGQPLRLSDESEITVAIPAMNHPDPEMQLFYGNASNGQVNDWTATSVAFRQEMEKEEDKYFVVDDELARRIAQLDIVVPEKPLKPTRPQVQQPIRPGVPLKPRTIATRPEWDTYVKIFGKRGKLNKRRFQKAMLEYEKDLAAYQSDSASCAEQKTQYEMALIDYNIAMEEYAGAYSVWKSGMKEYLTALNNYNSDLYVFHYTESLYRLCKGLPNRKAPMRYKVLRETLDDKAKLVAGHEIRTDPDYRTCKAERQSIQELLGLDSDHEHTSSLSGNKWVDGNYYMEYDPVNNKKIKLILWNSGISELSSELQGMHMDQLALNGSTRQKRKAINAYITEIGQLGWINVDKFYKNENPPTQLAFEGNGAFAMYAYFPELNSMLSIGKGDDGNFRVSSIPQGVTMELISLKSYDGKLWVSREQFITGQASNPAYDYKPYSLKAFKAELASL